MRQGGPVRSTMRRRKPPSKGDRPRSDLYVIEIEDAEGRCCSTRR